MKKITYIFLLWLISLNAGATVIVSFSPSSANVTVGDTFTVDVIADIPDPVIGWGLDISFDGSVLSLGGTPTIGGSWNSIFAPDGDGLAGIAPFPSTVSGSGIVLATLTFDALTAGVTDLIASISAGDLTEGFPLTLPGSFSPVTFINGSIVVSSASNTVPEPSIALLLILGFAGFNVFNKNAYKA